MVLITSVALLALSVPAVWAGMYSQPVINLDAKTFKQALSVEHAAMVAFVAPWCGHCKAMGPEFTAAAQSLSPLIPFYAIDCDEAKNKPLCAEYQIQGFPTIKAFPRALKGAAKDYQGERKRGALVEYAKSLVPDRVRKLRADEGAEKVLSKFLADKPNLPHTLLIHPSTPSIPFLWKVLGHRLSSKMNLGYVKDTPDHAVLTRLGIYDPADTSRDSVRAVYWEAGADTAKLAEFEGAFKFNALLEWLEALAAGRTPPPPEKSSSGSKQKPAQAPPADPSGEAGQESVSNEEAESLKRAEAERRAKLRAKMEEAERRDQIRREKLAQKAKEAAAAAAATEADSGDNRDATKASPVEDAPAPRAEEGVKEEALEGSSSAEGVVPGAGGAEEPVAGEEPVDAGSGARAEETRVHEEL